MTIQTGEILENTVIPTINSTSTSFFSKLFSGSFKYFILFLILIIIIFYYYKYKYKKNNSNSNNDNKNNKKILNEFVVTDLNGSLIKISGEYVGSLRNEKKHNQQQGPQGSQVQQEQRNIFQEETSEENNNIKQHDLTNSEINEITNKLKN